MSKVTVAIIAVLAILIVTTIYYTSNGIGTASVTGTQSCEQFVDAYGKTFSSYENMRQNLADLTSASDAQFRGLGLVERTDGVYICK